MHGELCKRRFQWEFPLHMNWQANSSTCTRRILCKHPTCEVRGLVSGRSQLCPWMNLVRLPTKSAARGWIWHGYGWRVLFVDEGGRIHASYVFCYRHPLPMAYFWVQLLAAASYWRLSVLYRWAISGTRGLSGFGSVSREEIDSSTLATALFFWIFGHHQNGYSPGYFSASMVREWKFHVENAGPQLYFTLENVATVLTVISSALANLCNFRKFTTSHSSTSYIVIWLT
jgi:hypothetical protein